MAVCLYIFSAPTRIAADRGRDGGLMPPLPPKRTGGFTPSSFPVCGVSARLTISARAVFQTKQPSRREPSVGPPSAVGLAQPVAGPFLPFAQQRPQASPQPAVRAAQARTMAFPEVAVPAPQDGIGLRNDLAQLSSSSAPAFRPPRAPPLPDSHAQAETRSSARRSRARGSVRARFARPLRRSDRAPREYRAGAFRSCRVWVSRRVAPVGGDSVWSAVLRAAGPIRSRRVRRTA